MCLQDVLSASFALSTHTKCLPPLSHHSAPLCATGESGAESKVASDQVRIVICATSQEWDTTTAGTTSTVQ